MAKLVEEYNNIRNTVLHQLKSYWMDTDEQVIDRALPNTLKAVEKNFYQLPNKRFYNENSVLFSPYMSVQWMIFLYRLSHEIYCEGGVLQRKQTKFIILIRSCIPMTGFMQ